jgi:hypothetical protein
MKMSDFKTTVEGYEAALNEVPPPPPPPPPFSVSTAAALIGGAGAGAIDGAIIGALSGAQPGMMDGLAKSPFLWWIVLGLIAGGLFGGVGSLIYNAIVRNSTTKSFVRNQRSKTFKKRYSDVKSIDPDRLFVDWIETKFALIFDYAEKTFKKRDDLDQGNPSQGKQV